MLFPAKFRVYIKATRGSKDLFSLKSYKPDLPLRVTIEPGHPEWYVHSAITQGVSIVSNHMMNK